MENRACLACGQLFSPRPQNPAQTYCTKKACQQERRRLWQQIKRDTDPDYVDNQARAHQAWLERNPDYWKQYRSAHPQYAEDNRAKQLVRNYKNRSCLIAKMDASNSANSELNGFYQLILLPNQMIAKKNAWTVYLSLLSAEKSRSSFMIAKRGRVAKAQYVC
ncbi:hypothetical protein [Undibacterium sp. TS12]|uniref:hypothetical protein n=1 Tax=Undibacterium sp. TS12 TaxID=2908202 RepID=UPI001F4C8F79|nr:hypothetical protein [Undibacterium sp. TS12]MCH8618158.1 hypothetical protein [Undibacterium sp. TS12]